METLSKLGRRQICKMVGIKNPDSIFVRNKEAFIDRMNLYNIMYNVKHIVSVYKEELEQFSSEEEYVEFLENGATSIGKYIESCIQITEKLSRLMGCDYVCESINKSKELIIHEKTEDNCYLRIYFSNPIFNGFKLLHYDERMKNLSFSDFVQSYTHSKFLALYNDIQPEWVSDETYKVLLNQTNELSDIIADIVSPKFLNSKFVKHIGKADVIFESTENKSLKAVDNIVKEIRNFSELDFSDACVELFKYKSLASNNSICRKEIIGPKGRGLYSIDKYSEYSLVRYLRKISEQQPTKYDNYIEIDGNEVKILKDRGINWVS